MPEFATTLTFNETTAAPHGLYAVVQDAATGFAWNGTTTVNFDTSDWATFARPLTQLSGGLWTIDIPWASLTAGKTYLFLIFRQATATPIRSDPELRSVWKSNWGSQVAGAGVTAEQTAISGGR